MNNLYRLLNLSALIVVCFNIDKIGLIGYVASTVLMWNVIEGVRTVEVVKEDKAKDLEIAMLKLRIVGLEGVVKASELVDKSNNMVIRDLKRQVENK
jgi:hypothetical protein